MTDAKLYGVSYGNGNDGVSQLYPAFYVRTDRPYDLAKLAVLSDFKVETVEWAQENLHIDGEAEFTIYATIFDPPSDKDENEEDEENDHIGSWSDANGAWYCVEVFPVDESDLRDRPKYDNLEDAFGKGIVEKYGEGE